MKDCIFCRIAQGEIPSEILYKDERVFVIRDIHPRAPTHLLIMPYAHIPYVSDLATDQEPLMGHLVTVANQMARQEGLHARGYRLTVNCKDDGGQQVTHLHLHLLGGRPLGSMG